VETVVVLKRVWVRCFAALKSMTAQLGAQAARGTSTAALSTASAHAVTSER
jgi:hypothetical protein